MVEKYANLLKGLSVGLQVTRKRKFNKKKEEIFLSLFKQKKQQKTCLRADIFISMLF